MGPVEKIPMKKFEINLRRKNIPREEFLNDLKRVAVLINKQTVTAATYDEKGKFGKATVLRRFGSWNNALGAAGLKVILTLNNKEEVLFENLANVWQKLGRQPVGRDLEKVFGHSRFSTGTYEKRFGSWNKALEAFGAFINGSTVLEENIDKHEKEISHSHSNRTFRKINWRLRAMVLIRDNCVCKMCGRSPVKEPAVILHVDHIKPWSKGGETAIENLQTLCSMCNVGKSDLE